MPVVLRWCWRRSRRSQYDGTLDVYVTSGGWRRRFGADNMVSCTNHNVSIALGSRPYGGGRGRSRRYSKHVCDWFPTPYTLSQSDSGAVDLPVERLHQGRLYVGGCNNVALNNRCTNLIKPFQLTKAVVVNAL